MRTLFIAERVTRFTHDALPHPIELEQKPDADVPHEADGTVQVSSCGSGFLFICRPKLALTPARR